MAKPAEAEPRAVARSRQKQAPGAITAPWPGCRNLRLSRLPVKRQPHLITGTQGRGIVTSSSLGAKSQNPTDGTTPDAAL